MTERSRSVADPKVVAHATVSLDGFIATPDDTLNWIFDYIETSGAVEDEIFSGAGALLSGDIRTTVATALATAEGKDLIVTGGDVVRQCLDAQLVDEIVLHVVPVLLGDGVPLFRGREYNPTNLETIEATRRKTITELRFRVIK